MHFSRSPFMAFAVNAMIGRFRNWFMARIARVVSYPSISGIMTSIRIRSTSLSLPSEARASLPFSAKVTVMPCPASTLVRENMLRTSAAPLMTFLPVNSPPALLVGELGLDTMQEERSLVEQPFRRLHILDDDRLGVLAQPRFLGRGEVAPGVDDDRQVLAPLIGLHPLEELESVHVLQAEVEHHAIVGRVLELGERLLGRGDRGDVHVLVRDELDHALPLVLVILDHQQVPNSLVDEVRDPA